MPTLPLALTMGDPAGIGLDITTAIWAKRRDNQCPPFVLYADPHALQDRATQLHHALKIKVVSSLGQGLDCFASALPVLPLKLPSRALPGRPDSSNAATIINSIEQASQAVHEGQAAAIVTNPIAKSVLYAAGFQYPGHTEYLAALAGKFHAGHLFQPVMMLAADDLRVVPLTVHIPLADVPMAITAELIADTASITAKALVREFALTKPRIAVAGLNPHAGENGSIGKEDQDIIAPAITQLQAAGMAITGPHPGDTLFHAQARQNYDAVIAMYHDQALIPLKTLAFDRGVNITLGLPFVRTSPDHGTAFDIAGSGTASSASLLAALQQAAALSARRRAYDLA